MIVDIDTSTASCSLLEADVFTAFHVRSDTAAASEAAAAMGSAGDAADEPDHVWVSIEWLIGAGGGDDAWRTQFDAMVGFAASKGWINDEGTHLKAHLEPR